MNTDLYSLYPNHYVSAINKDRFLDLNYQLAIYLLRKQEIEEGLEKLIYALQYAVSLNNKEFFIKMVPLFEQHRSFATQVQLQQYESLMREVLKVAEVGSGVRFVD